MNRRYLCLALIIIAGVLLRVYNFFKLPPPSLDLPNHIATAIISVLLIPLIYKLAKDVTSDTQAGLFAGLLAATVPLYSWKTVGQFMHALGVGFFLFSVFAFLQIKKLDWRVAILVPAIFAFVHAYSLLLIPAFGIYVLLVKLEQHQMSKNEIYFILTSVVIISAVNILFLSPVTLYFLKNYIQNYYNIIAAEHFSLVATFNIVGLLPIYLGVIGVYFGLQLRKKSVLLLIATVIGPLCAMLLGLVPVILGLPYFALPLCALGGFFFLEFQRRIRISRVKKFERELAVLIFIITFLLASGHWFI